MRILHRLREPVPDRFAHQAGTSPPTTTVSYFLVNSCELGGLIEVTVTMVKS